MPPTTRKQREIANAKAYFNALQIRNANAATLHTITLTPVRHAPRNGTGTRNARHVTPLRRASPMGHPPVTPDNASRRASEIASAKAYFEQRTQQQQSQRNTASTIPGFMPPVPSPVTPDNASRRASEIASAKAYYEQRTQQQQSQRNTASTIRGFMPSVPSPVAPDNASRRASEIAKGKAYYEQRTQQQQSQRNTASTIPGFMPPVPSPVTPDNASRRASEIASAKAYYEQRTQQQQSQRNTASTMPGFMPSVPSPVALDNGSRRGAVAAIQAEDDRKPAAQAKEDLLDLTKNTDDDEAVDMEIELLETELHELRKQDEEQQMGCGPTGRAWQFVSQVLAMTERLGKSDPEAAKTVQPVAIDDMVYTAERLLEAQEAFRSAGKPIAVDVGYHYTQPQNLDSIKENGLMSKLERQEKKIESKFNGAVYGHGIYTAVDPMAFSTGFGDTGLMIARLPGVNADYIPPKNPAPSAIHMQGFLPAMGGTASVEPYDSLTGHRGQYSEFTVLSCSQMCIPVLQYKAEHVWAGTTHPGTTRQVIDKFHAELQGIIDKLFNN